MLLLKYLWITPAVSLREWAGTFIAKHVIEIWGNFCSLGLRNGKFFDMLLTANTLLILLKGPVTLLCIALAYASV